MRRRLPPLNTLRVFESAARRLSFTRAAEELHVTQAAVSHQVKALEEWLGTPLFMRLKRGLKLTDAAERYLEEISDAFDLIANSTAALARHEGKRVLAVATLDSFASIWLLPRLSLFRRGRPDIDVRVVAVEREIDVFEDGEIDIDLRYGDGHWPGLSVTKLMEEDIFPVCSSALAAGPPALREPADLKRHTLLHDVMTMDWNTWLAEAGVSGVDGKRGPGFNHSYLVTQAAINGEGVALGRSVLVAEAIARGQLVRPFELRIPSALSYYLVCPVSLAAEPTVAAFREWMVEQSQQLPSV
jgi:LysR family glycine cleavage system transcriptional activator